MLAVYITTRANLLIKIKLLFTIQQKTKISNLFVYNLLINIHVHIHSY